MYDDFDLMKEYNYYIETGKLTLTDKQKEAIRTHGYMDTFFSNEERRKGIQDKVKNVALRGLVGYYRHHNQGGKRFSDSKKNEIINNRYDKLAEVHKLIKHRTDNPTAHSPKRGIEAMRDAEQRQRDYNKLKEKIKAK